MEAPRISVVTPTFNQGAFIEKTIDSVLSQGYPNLEYIIVDGGSKDNTVEVIKKYERHLAYWVSEADRGQSHAINKGMERASGEYLTWLNSDDWYTPRALWKFSEIAKQQPTAGLIVGAGRMVDGDGTCIFYKEPSEQITLNTLYDWFNNGYFVQPSSVFSRTAWSTCGPIDENEHIALDLDFWLKIAQSGLEIVSTNECLSEALTHPEAKTTAFKDLMQIEGLLVIGKHGGDEQMRHGMRKIGNQVEQLTKRLEWYEKNYEILVNHPIARFLRPMIKRLSKEGTYWQDKVPPWVKGLSNNI